MREAALEEEEVRVEVEGDDHDDMVVLAELRLLELIPSRFDSYIVGPGRPGLRHTHTHTHTTHNTPPLPASVILLYVVFF